MRPTRFFTRCSTGCLLWLAILSVGQAAQAQQEVSVVGKKLERRVAALIEQLGDKNFNRREYAQRRLQQLGLAAYDAIHRAQQHDDIEIAARASYMVRSMRIQWSRTDDPAEIRRILIGYADKSPKERRNRMERLAALDDNLGLAGLCRLVRYETSAPLSKYAALLIMQQQAPDDKTKATTLAAELRDAVKQSTRVAAGWIRIHARTLEDPESALPQWQQICHEEETTLTQFPKDTTREITRDLLRRYARLLGEIDRLEESLAVLRRTINLLNGTRIQLQEMSEWLADNEAWSLVQDVADRFPSEFSKYPDLVYRLAESHLKGGDSEKAELAAARARAIDPDNSRSHIESALWLQRRNLIPWCIEEYRVVVDKAELRSREGLYARFLLSEILHDQDQDTEAASILAGAVEAVQDDRTAQEVEQIFSRKPAGIQSRRLYFQSQAKMREKMFDEQKELLQKAIEADPNDGDVLIAVYRFTKADEDFKKRSLDLIKASTEHYRVEIELYSNTYRVSGDPSERQTARRKLAGANNQLAWLVSNTVGDYAEAVRCSVRSLELRPDSPGYLDTLGHCYYAVGNFAEAVKAQQQAVDGDPGSRQMARMLKVFQDALAKEKS